MHIPLLRTLVLASLLAVLAACSDVSSVDAPAVEEAKATPISASEVNASTLDEVTEDGLADGELETSQDTINRFAILTGDASRRPNNGVCFYTDVNYQGRSYCYEAGVFTIPAGFTAGVSGIRPSFNDTASSVALSSGYRLQMFRDAGYTGGGFGFDNAFPGLQGFRSLEDFGNQNFNNELSSFVLTKGEIN